MTFPYFGRKATLAPLYPAPMYPLVIEPFAGSLAYTLHHRPERSVGIERDERVVALWHRLASMTEVPTPPVLGSKTDDLMVKLCSYSEHSLTSGSMTVTSRMLRDWQSVHRRAIAASDYMRTVDYRLGTYGDAGNPTATWFIDPPYQLANRRGYLHGAAGIDYDELAEWVMTRSGQVIVCEQAGATWLPFTPLADVVSHRGVRKSEVVWISRPPTRGCCEWPGEHSHANPAPNTEGDSPYCEAQVGGMECGVSVLRWGIQCAKHDPPVAPNTEGEG